MASFTQHPHGVPTLEITFRKSNAIVWVILRGEADIATVEQLDHALDHAELDDTESIHLHVKDLDFIDVTTVRRLIFFATRAQEAGRHVKTCGANPTFRMLAGLLEARDVLGLL